MDRAWSRPRTPLLRRLARNLWPAAPLLGLGCASTEAVTSSAPPAVTAPPAAVTAPVRSPIQTVSHEAPAVEPAPEQAKPHPMPITLDTVLRLAEEHNPKIGLAREKLHESVLVQEQNCRNWMPNTYAGVAYYRHEGGIQNENGSLTNSSTQALYPGLQINSELDLREATFRQINAERQTWQQKAELSQVDSEVLLEAATTYIDLLTARRGEALSQEMMAYERKVLARAEKLDQEGGPHGVVQSVKAAVNNHEQMIARLHQAGDAASAKLVYLLGLPPCTELVPMDLVPAPIELVDVNAPVCDLVAQAMANGPSVKELEGLLAIIQTGIDKSYGLHNLLPSVQLNVLEGDFGAGPGSHMSFDNRLDLGVQVRWNLTQLAHAHLLRQQAYSKQQQAMLSYEDVRGKLAAGVAESRGAVLAGRQQVGYATDQIKNADVSYRESDKRLQENLPGGSVNDALMAIRGLEQAHFSYLNNVSNHNKAQVRLLLLLGLGPTKDAPACHP
jgi:outer membrane protein TolC